MEEQRVQSSNWRCLFWRKASNHTHEVDRKASELIIVRHEMFTDVAMVSVRSDEDGPLS